MENFWTNSLKSKDGFNGINQTIQIQNEAINEGIKEQFSTLSEQIVC